MKYYQRKSKIKNLTIKSLKRMKKFLNHAPIKMDNKIMKEAIRAKYLIIGGYIFSKHDQGKHYITAHVLMRLYNLQLEECILAEHHDKILIESALHHEPKLIVLKPRTDGNYKL